MATSYTELQKFYGAGVKQDVLANWNKVEIHIHPVLTLEETLLFVHDVASACFEANTGEYLPEVRDFAYRCSVLEKYANIELPEDISEKHKLVYNTDLYHFVTSRIDFEQLNEIEVAIDKKIDNLAYSKINAFENKLNELTSNIESVSNAFTELYSGIDKDTITNIANAVSNGIFDEKKLVDAYIEHQSKS